MVMHASEIPEGNYWQKVVAQEALKTLSSYDYAGMLHWEKARRPGCSRSSRSARARGGCFGRSTA